MQISTEYRNLLDNKGVSLHERFHLSDRALRRDDAVTAVDILLRDGVLILGGDVFLQTEKGIELARASWSIDGGPIFSDSDVLRGGQLAKNYVEAFPEDPGEIPLSVLVVAM